MQKKSKAVLKQEALMKQRLDKEVAMIQQQADELLGGERALNRQKELDELKGLN